MKWDTSRGAPRRNGRCTLPNRRVNARPWATATPLPDRSQGPTDRGLRHRQKSLRSGGTLIGNLGDDKVADLLKFCQQEFVEI
jgi:hypothetical protein